MFAISAMLQNSRLVQFAAGFVKTRALSCMEVRVIAKCLSFSESLAEVRGGFLFGSVFSLSICHRTWLELDFLDWLFFLEIRDFLSDSLEHFP